MAIDRIDPPQLDEANVVQVDSTAPGNHEAIDEIEAWAAKNGFARVNEYQLRLIIRSDDTKVFRGVCYRITQEVSDSNRSTIEQITERAEHHPFPTESE